MDRQIFTKKCKRCGHQFEFRAFKTEVATRIYCGRICANKANTKANSNAKLGARNPMYGKRPANFKGIKISYDGYFIINLYGKDYKLHRLIYEAYHGVKLKAKNVIHHKDGNKLNNNINNLILCKDEREHRLHHKKYGKGHKCHGPEQQT